MDDEDYGDIPDEDLIEAFSQASQTLPPPKPSKRQRYSNEIEDNDVPPNRRRRMSRQSTGSGVSADEGEESAKAKKPKYRIHVGDKEVPAGRIIAATQAEALPDSSPYRIRGPIYKKPRPADPKPAPLFPVAAQNTQRSNPFQRQIAAQPLASVFDRELEELPSDAFSSQEPIAIGSSPLRESQETSRPRQRLVAPLQGLRQTTLFGGRAPEEVSASQAKKVHNFIVDRPPEPPTHHKLVPEAIKTWVYPTNLGAIRDYQYSIVRHALFHNTLVALPTGLGKTFIAATIMYNFYRWTEDAQIVFVAPTKPLVAQQVEACFGIVGIPKSETTMLTGEQVPALRAEEWQSKRVFFMTPQTLENDLSSGIADPKKIVLLVVDEAHRATGNYAYVKVVSFLRRFNKSFRVLALTATPGASVEAVQEVVDGLEISKVEIRTEESIDIQQYVHKRNIDQIILDPSDEMVMIKDLFAKSLQPLLNQLCGQNGYYNRDPMSLTPFGMMQARKAWFASGAGKSANPGLKGMMHALFSTLASVAHSIKLLNFHGIGPFFSTIKEFRQNGEEAKNGGKYRKQILEHPDFRKMMDRIQMWINKEDFIGHPKLTYLCDTVLNHFLDAGEGRLDEDSPPSSTRVIVFAEFRDSAEDITRVLNRHGPMIRASVFVGQADSKRSEGMNQAKQIETIDKFKNGQINVLVATSIGEEGLDIGQVDLIVCYDASGSPIRMLQRMGRTGRKRAGNITLLLMRGKEEELFEKAKDNYEQMQKMITSGARFNFRHDLSVRILPRDIIPEVDKRQIEIPLENTQDPSLPEPKRRRASKPKKKPPKKFHMPDGVEIGFQTASKLSGKDVPTKSLVAKANPVERKETQLELAPIPIIESVLLSPAELGQLQRDYQNVAGTEMQEVGMPDMTAHPIAQRSLGPVDKVQHGRHTKRCVELFKLLANSQTVEERYVRPYGRTAPSLPVLRISPLVEDESRVPKVSKRTRVEEVHVEEVLRHEPISSIDSVVDEPTPQARKRQLASQASELSEQSPEPDSEGEGDDVMNSEEHSEDESDGGGSLRDFVVKSTAPQISSMAQSSQPALAPSSQSVLVPSSQIVCNWSSKTTEISSTDDDDNEDICSPLPTSARAFLDSDDIQQAISRKRRKTVIEDSDDDE